MMGKEGLQQGHTSQCHLESETHGASEGMESGKYILGINRLSCMSFRGRSHIGISFALNTETTDLQWLGNKKKRFPCWS